MNQIDYAVKRHDEVKEKKQQRRQRILDSKLKSKGDLLLEASEVKDSISK